MASYRLPREESIVTRRSHCPKCGHDLGVLDLIPLFSWLFSGGKCRYCGVKISVRYPVIELIAAALLLSSVWYYGMTLQAAVIALMALTLLTMFISDFETKLIPDEIHWMLLATGVAHHYLQHTPWQMVLMTMFLTGVIGLLLHYGYYFLRGRHGLGFGDVKFLFVVGLWLAQPQSLPFFFFLSGLMGVLTGVTWRYVSDDPRFPFGPALGMALIIMVIWPQAEKIFWLKLFQWLV